MSTGFFDGKIYAYRTALNVVRNLGADPDVIQELTNLLADAVDSKAVVEKKDYPPCPCPNP